MKEGSFMSLHKAIIRVLVFVAGGIVVLLGLLDVYLMQSYQRTLMAEWREKVNRYADEVKGDLDAISSDLYDIYYYDSNYQMLSTALDIDAFPYAHELEERLKTQLLLKKRAAGYVVYFDDLKSRRYFFNKEGLSNRELEALKELTSELSGTSGSLRTWYYRAVENKAYAIGIYRNNGVSLSELYCLEDCRKELSDELSELQADVFYEYDGRIMNSPEAADDQSEILELQDEEKEGIYYYRRQIRGTDLVLHLTVPIRFDTFLNIQQIIVFAVIFMVVLASVLFYFRLSRELFHPMDNLIEDMKRIGGGEWETGIHSQSRFIEVQQVIETTDRMVEEIEAQRLLTYEKTIQEQKARLQYLSLQLNPHFYLNGLKTLNYLAIKGENDRIQEIILRLSAHLRYLLQLEDEMVPLDQEVKFVKSYIALYVEMTGRNILEEWKVDEETTLCLVPRLCIQTFVENSFKYAKVDNTAVPLELVISANRFSDGKDRYLEIQIRDSGEGYSEKLLEVLNEPPTEGGLSVGINNLKRRCGFLYEKEVQYAFYNDGGAVSDLFLPWVEKGFEAGGLKE